MVVDKIPSQLTQLPPAIVVGLCAHGLSIVRSLSGYNFEVFAIESNTKLPGIHTRLARVLTIKNDINTEALVDTLLLLYEQYWSAPHSRPVLFLTNDNMVRNIGTHWQRLKEKFLLSWSESRLDVLKLIDKSFLETHCQATELNYPRSWIAASVENLSKILIEIKFPVMVKPIKPLSGFKAEKIKNKQELLSLAERFESSFPILVQDWIEGNDTHLHFCNTYLSEGSALGRFEGRKLRSSPPARGQGTVVEPFISDEVYQLTIRFFKPLRLSGPSALELKRDSLDRWWVIEPTVGRTEFLVGCCVANNVNIPLIEYFHQTGHINNYQPQAENCIWFNAERDPVGFLSYIIGSIKAKRRYYKWKFLYLSKSDPYPFLVAFYQAIFSFLYRGLRKLIRPTGIGSVSNKTLH